MKLTEEGDAIEMATCLGIELGTEANDDMTMMESRDLEARTMSMSGSFIAAYFISFRTSIPATFKYIFCFFQRV